MEKEEKYEDQVRREFEMTQESDTSNNQDVVKNLGKVELDKGNDINSDPDIQRINNTMGYINIPLDTLPSMGRFYPENTRITIRAARVGEIREFSVIDEEDPKDVMDKMTYIISQCVKIYYGNTLGHYRDILDDDKIVLILKIRELTFVDSQSSIPIPVPAGTCKTPGCTPQDTVYFSSNKLEFQEPNTKLEKYYDSVERCYNIQTKKFGVIKLYPPTIGVNDILAGWIREQQKENRKLDVALLNILPYVIPSWRTFSDKQVFPKLTELAGWSTEKFTLVTRLREEINIGIKFDITERCAQCGGELKIPVSFPGGFRSLFVPTISDLGGELL